MIVQMDGLHHNNINLVLKFVLTEHMHKIHLIDVSFSVRINNGQMILQKLVCLDVIIIINLQTIQQINVWINVQIIQICMVNKLLMNVFYHALMQVIIQIQFQDYVYKIVLIHILQTLELEIVY
jgi:hypothetical protein